MAGTEERQTFYTELEGARADQDKIIEFYDKNASKYNGMMEPGGYTDTTDYFASVLNEFVGDNSKEILDVGCGTGKTGTSLKKSGFVNIDGVDPSVESLKISKETGSYKKVFEGKITESEKLSCADGSYDGVLCVGCITLGHLKLDDALPEFIRVLKQGGIAVYMTSDRLDQVENLKKHIPYLSEKKIELLRFERRLNHQISYPVYSRLYVVKKL